MMLKHQFESQLPLYDAEVLIRTFRETDITDRYIGWLNDAELMRFSNQRFLSHDAGSCLKYYRSIITSSASFLAIEHKHFGVVGTMTVYFNDHHGTADMGILIGETSLRGAGVGLTAWTLIQNSCLNLPAVRKVTAGTLSCNTPMLRLAKLSGMLPDGVRRAQELVDGQARDICYFAIFCDAD